MKSFVIHSPEERDDLFTVFRALTMPFSVNYTIGKRTLPQNALSHMWHQEAAEQLKDMSANEYRAYSKLHHGVPILRIENEKFREQYDRIIKPLTYAEKLQCMSPPFDLPVTSLMDKEQKARYLDAIYQDYTGRGVRLTEPRRT